MNSIQTIHDLANEYHDEEMDSWYWGPCSQVRNISLEFDSAEWSRFIKSTEIDKPDMWRVFLAHSFIDSRHFGQSREFIIEQAIRCKSQSDAHLIIQYLDDFDWDKVQTNYKNRMFSKIKELARIYPLTYRDILNAIEH